LGRGCSVKRVDVYLPPQMVRQDPDIGSVGRGLGGSQVSGFATEQSSGVLHDHGHQPGLSIPAAPYWHLWRSWRGLSPQIGKFSNGVVHFQIVSPFPSAVARRLRRSHGSRGTLGGRWRGDLLQAMRQLGRQGVVPSSFRLSLTLSNSFFRSGQQHSSAGSLQRKRAGSPDEDVWLELSK
jgi:hypothetical protein